MGEGQCLSVWESGTGKKVQEFCPFDMSLKLRAWSNICSPCQYDGTGYIRVQVVMYTILLVERKKGIYARERSSNREAQSRITCWADHRMNPTCTALTTRKVENIDVEMRMGPPPQLTDIFHT